MDRLDKRFPRYSKLLNLYPEKYRNDYSEQMLQTLADMLDSAPTATERLKIWARLVFDFSTTVLVQNVHNLGGIMAHDTPKYVKRNAVIGGILLLPFFIAVTLNSLNELVNHHTLFHSWLWSTPVLALWVMWLPLAAAILGLTSLLFFINFQTKAKRTSSFKALLDLRYNWPLVAVALIGSFILFAVFFHDSVHCVTGNPVSELRNPKATWHCVQNSR